jgi:transcriptional regulator with XRE-family HTH domain
MNAESIKTRLGELFIVVGDNIVRLRTGVGMSQKELASKSGVSRTTINSTEQGVPCSFSNLMKIAIALDVNPADLFLTDKDRHEVTYKAKLLCDKLSEFMSIK